MGLLMRNGIAYAGSNSIELTQAEYNALVSAGTVQPDTFYCIVDADNVFPAGDVTYDNTDSGLSANRVQSAIDETNTLLSAIPNLNNIALQSATLNTSAGFTQGQCRYIKCGKLVIGLIEDLIGVNSTHNAVVFTNLPVAQNSVIGLIEMTGGSFKAPFRVRIGANGEILNWYSSINNVQGSEGYLVFAYVST